jgi:exodeoxyribonuclease V gamma subunit
LEEYTPFISSVFESGDYLYNFPYSIEKQHFNSIDSKAAVVDNLLNFEERNFTSEQVLQLLENKALSDVFGINDLDKLRELLAEANICRDYKGKGDIENETYLVSFRYGLQRLAYGFALGEDVNFISDGISFEAPERSEVFPCGNFDGSSDQLQFSRFYAFVESLHQLLEQRNGEKRLTEWTDYMKEYLLSAFIYLDEKEEDIEALISEADIEDSDEENNSRFFENAIDDFLSASANPNAEELISFEVFRLLFTGFISNRITERGSYRGGITFANFQSMQGLDYKFIAILGMDYDVLPRNKQLPYFHLENKTKIGSFNIKESDKYTFLQTLLAAGENLYLSYIGRSPKDNSKRPASVLIDQVLDSFERRTEEPKPESYFWIQHPLHSFSSRYNQEQYPMLKRHKIKKPSEISISSLDKKEEKPEISSISLDQLIAFVKNPFKHYLNKAFGIYLTEEDNSLNENELLDDPDNLIKYYIKNELIELSEEILADITRKFKHKAFVPLSNIGTSITQNIDKDIRQMRTEFNNLKEDSEAVSLTETLVLKKSVSALK